MSSRERCSPASADRRRHSQQTAFPGGYAEAPNREADAIVLACLRKTIAAADAFCS